MRGRKRDTMSNKETIYINAIDRQSIRTRQQKNIRKQNGKSFQR